MGEVLIAGTAALLICIFLSPKFIAFLREREFGQHIREEGPEGHHAKAGTPTMGGIIIFVGDLDPVPDPVGLRLAAVGVYGAAMLCALLGFADDYTKIVQRRSLGLRGRTKLGVTILDLDRPLVGRDAAGGARRDAAPAHRRRADRPRASSTRSLIYLVVAGTTNAVNLTDGLDGLAAGCAAIVLLAYIGITFITTGQHDLALLSRLPRRRVRRVPVVQRLPGDDLHGGHRVARAGRRDRRDGGHDEDGDPAASCSAGSS